MVTVSRNTSYVKIIFLSGSVQCSFFYSIFIHYAKKLIQDGGPITIKYNQGLHNNCFDQSVGSVTSLSFRGVQTNQSTRRTRGKLQFPKGISYILAKSMSMVQILIANFHQHLTLKLASAIFGLALTAQEGKNFR